MNEYGFYIIIGDFNYFVFWRNLVNAVLIILVILLLYVILRILKNRIIDEKTITYTNLSTIIYKWNNRAIITFSDLSRFVGKLKNNLPHGNGKFINNNYAPANLKFNEGESSLVKIFKTENGYNYNFISKNNIIFNKQLITLLKYIVSINSLALLIAIAKMPYGYYIFLRILTTITFCIFVYIAYIENKIKTASLSGILAIIYNPIVRFPLGKDVWIIINLITIPIILLLYIINRRSQ